MKKRMIGVTTPTLVAVLIMVQILGRVTIASPSDEPVVLYTLADTYIASGDDERQQEHGKARGIWLGRNTVNGYGEQIPFIMFPLTTPVEGQVLTSAHLELNLKWSSGDMSPFNTEVVLLSGSWTEELTWLDYLAMRDNGTIHEVAQSPGVAIAGTPLGPVSFDITALVAQWLSLDQEAETIGFLIRPVNLPDGEVERGFWSRDCGADCSPPRLFLTYATLDANVTLEAQPSIQPAYLDDIPFTVTVTNSGEVPLSNTQVVVTKPDNAEWPDNPAQFIAPFAVPGESELTWTIDLDVNETRKFRYALRPKQAEGSSQGTLQSAPVLVRGTYSGITRDVPFEFLSNVVSPLDYINLGIGTSFTSAPAVVATDTKLLTYALIITNLSDADLDSWTVHATAPSGTRLTKEPGGTIPEPTKAVTTTGDITWTMTIARGEAFTIQYSPAIINPPAVIKHDPIVITGFYKLADGVSESKQYTFTTNSVVNLVKFGDARHIYLPRASKPQ